MKIQLVDLNAQYLSIKAEIDQTVLQTINEGSFILGENVNAFEMRFSEFCGCHYAAGVASGTAALTLCLKACNLQPGDEVITTPLTFVATTEAIVNSGAKPVFVDVDPITGNINPEQITDVITARTKVILPVHLYGHPVDMTAILNVARQHDLLVIEDASHAHGATYFGKKVGSLGDAACFSLYPSKILGACGDAGIVVSNNAAIIENVKNLRNHGQSEKHIYETQGYCERLDNIQAAVLLVKLKYLPEWIRTRRKIAEMLGDGLANTTRITIPIQKPNTEHVYHLFVIRLQKREALKLWLKQNGIDSGIHYPTPIHLLPQYTMLNYRSGNFPCAEQFANEVLSLPIYPEMTNEQVGMVINTIMNFSI